MPSLVAFRGVNVKAVVTSDELRVTGPVLVLNEETPLLPPPPQLELVSEGWQTWTGVPEGYR